MRKKIGKRSEKMQLLRKTHHQNCKRKNMENTDYVGIIAYNVRNYNLV